MQLVQKTDGKSKKTQNKLEQNKAKDDGEKSIKNNHQIRRVNENERTNERKHTEIYCFGKEVRKKPNNKYLCVIQNGKPDQQFNSQQHHGHEILDPRMRLHTNTLAHMKPTSQRFNEHLAERD